MAIDNIEHKMLKNLVEVTVNKTLVDLSIIDKAYYKQILIDLFISDRLGCQQIFGRFPGSKHILVDLFIPEIRGCSFIFKPWVYFFIDLENLSLVTV